MRRYMYCQVWILFLLLLIGNLKQDVSKREISQIILKGDLDKITYFLESGMTPNLRDEFGETILMDAARYSQPKIISILLSNGAYVNASSNSLHTALYYATYSGCYNCAQILLNAGADVNQISTGGNTALSNAAEGGYTNILKLLILRGANVNTTNKEGVTPLMKVYDPLGETENTALLVKAGADVNAASKDKRTALMFAANTCHTAKVKLFIDRGADVNVRSANGDTALSLAKSKWACGDIVKLLLKAGAK